MYTRATVPIEHTRGYFVRLYGEMFSVLYSSLVRKVVLRELLAKDDNCIFLWKNHQKKNIFSLRKEDYN